MFSIVTANWNGEKFLKVFLKSLVDQTYKNFKLYIVDNGSTDNSQKIIESFKRNLNIKLINLNENTGFAKANNIGICEAMKDDNEYIITLNNDIELDENCFMNLKEGIAKNKSHDVFQILLLNYFERNTIDAAGIEFDKYYFANQIGFKKNIEELKKLNEDIDGVCAGAAVYSKKCLKNTSLKNSNEFFNSTYFAYYEDVDLSLRLKSAGYSFFLIKNSIAYHIHSGTGGNNSYFKSYYLSRNLLLYIKYNIGNDFLKKNKRVYLFYFLERMLKLLVRANFRAVYGTLKGYFDYRKIQSYNNIN